VQGITDSAAVILLFSEYADASRHVKRELKIADRHRKPIYPIRLENVQPRNLEYLLTEIQWIEWLEDRDKTLESLVEHLTAAPLAGAPALPPEHAEKTSQALPAQTWPRVTVGLRTDHDAAETTARIIYAMAHQHPDETVILPTGRTSTPIFRSMVRIAREYGDRPFGWARVMNDTETFGVWDGHDTSRSNHVRRMLIDRLRSDGLEVPDDQVHLLKGIILAEDPIREARRLLRDNPPSVHVISIAPTGEVLAYEVAKYPDADELALDPCGVVEVGRQGKDYIDPDQPSHSIVTVGMAASLSSRLLVVPILDAGKTSILRQMCFFQERSGVPATVLRRHERAVIVTTQSIAVQADLDRVELCKTVGQALEVVGESVGIDLSFP
jgi:6-phosphogluconolactonase/glucosamine-6-phosphate isomerase/deaminase